MQNKFKKLPLLLASATMLPLLNCAAADMQYMKLSLPGGGAFQYPVYVYQQNNGLKLINTITSADEALFLGEKAAGEFYLYHQDPNGQWRGCIFATNNQGLLDTTHTTCSGAVSNEIQGNEVLSAIGSDAMPLLSSSQGNVMPITPPDNPQPPKFSERTLTFVNTIKKYKAIKIRELCSANSNDFRNPKCQEDTILNYGNSSVIHVGKDAWPSIAYAVTAFQKDDGTWISTGNYDSGHAYATKFEATWEPITVNGNVITGVVDTNLDVSAVDGFNFGFKMYPTTPTYCTYADSRLSGAPQDVGLYDSDHPMAEFPLNDSTSLEQVCNEADQEQAPDGVLNLLQKSSDGAFEGCYSPCTAAQAQGLSQTTIDAYCCSGPDHDPAVCSDGIGGHSKYDAALAESSVHTYRYAYDDAHGDYGCNGLTNFVIEITDGSITPPTSSLTPPTNVAASQIQQTSAEINWTAATDSNPQAKISYTVAAQAQKGGSPVSCSLDGATSAACNGLSVDTTYTVTVKASDNLGADPKSATTPPFTTGKPTPPPGNTVKLHSDLPNGGQNMTTLIIGGNSVDSVTGSDYSLPIGVIIPVTMTFKYYQPQNQSCSLKIIKDGGYYTDLTIPDHCSDISITPDPATQGKYDLEFPDHQQPQP